MNDAAEGCLMMIARVVWGVVSWLPLPLRLLLAVVAALSAVWVAVLMVTEAPA